MRWSVHVWRVMLKGGVTTGVATGSCAGFATNGQLSLRSGTQSRSVSRKWIVPVMSAVSVPALSSLMTHPTIVHPASKCTFVARTTCIVTAPCVRSIVPVTSSLGRLYPVSRPPLTTAGELVHESIAVTTNELRVGFVATHDTVGATVSTTVTVSFEMAWLPDASVAVHVTTVVPTKNFGGALFVNVTVPAQSSVAIGSPSGGEMQSFRSR